LLKIDTDDLQVIVPKPAKLKAKVPEGFDSFDKVGYNDGVYLEEGELHSNYHWGSTLSGVPHGWGRMKFSERKHFNIANKDVRNIDYVFYEGMFKYGSIHGKGKMWAVEYS